MTEDLRVRIVAAEQAAIAIETVTTMRHDVRNKLAAARQAGFYLKTKSRGTELWQTDPRVERFFGIIDEQLTLADAMLSDGGHIGRLYAREASPSDPRELASAALELSGLASSAAEELPTSRVNADPAEVIVALRCLLDNALRFAARRENVSLTGKVGSAQYAFSVSNDGPTLSPEHFQRCLRPFQADGSQAADGKATRGLGLAMAKRIANRYGGTLRLAETTAGTQIELSVELAQ